jgi:hypothetical protein
MRRFHPVLIAAVILVLGGALLYFTALREPTGRATGGAGGCGGDFEEGGEGAEISDQYDAEELVQVLEEQEPIEEFSANLLSYVYSVYKFAGYEEVVTAVDFTMISAQDMAGLYNGAYAVDSPNLPVGTIREKGSSISIFLRSGVTLDHVLRAVHHELGDALALRLSKSKEIKGQYWSELNRVFMTMVAHAHNPAIGALVAESLFWPLPGTAAELSNYHRGYVLAIHLLGEHGFDMEAVQEIVDEATEEELDHMALEVVSANPSESVLSALLKIRKDNQFDFQISYMDYVIALFILGDRYDEMLGYYYEDANQSALEAAVEIIDTMGAYPNKQFPLINDKHVVAYNIAALLNRQTGDVNGVRQVTTDFWDKFTPYLGGDQVSPVFQDRGPSTLFARAAAEESAQQIESAVEWAQRTVAFEGWFDYAEGASGLKAITNAKLLLQNNGAL